MFAPGSWSARSAEVTARPGPTRRRLVELAESEVPGIFETLPPDARLLKVFARMRGLGRLAER